jgi:hypothetical protein
VIVMSKDNEMKFEELAPYGLKLQDSKDEFAREQALLGSSELFFP